MAQNQVDVVDLGPLVGLPLFAGFVFGVWSLSLNIFGGFDFNSVLWSGSGIEVTWALLLTIFSVGAVVVTNELDGSNYEQYEYGAIVFVLALPVLYAAVPAVADFINGNDIWKFLAWMLISVVTAYIGYVE